MAGVTVGDAFDSALFPTLLMALTRKVYAVPLVNPVTVAVAVGDVPSSNVVQVVLSDENSTR